MVELGQIGRSWAAVAQSAYRSIRDTILSGGRTGQHPSLVARETGAAASLRRAGEQLRDAFASFATRMKPVYGTELYRGLATAAKAEGVSARIAAVAGYSVLETTVRVNTRSSTVRASAAALGLDVTSPAAASTLASSSSLGLDVASAEAASTRVSTAEMNAGFDTSYGSGSLTFRNGGTTSSSTATLTGTYTGTGLAANATSLIFEITRGDTIGALAGLGEGNVDFRVTDQSGTELFAYTGQPLGNGEQVYLGDDIGLSLSFSNGTVTAGHTATATLARTAITVDANAAFNAPAAARPRFENNAVVTAGSFSINGTSIMVHANDTINTVLSRINASAAGVTATLSDDRVTLTSSGYSEDAIALTGDTSGFLAATRLAGAATTLGNVRDDQQVLAKTSQFGAVATGSFTVNGVSIAVDRDADSLDDIISRINAAGAGVTATYNAATDLIELETTGPSEDLIVVGDDTSGFLDAANLRSDRTVRGNIADDEQVFAKTTQFAGVVDGSFAINGVTISVDSADDSLDALLARINASGAGVTATYDGATDRVVFTPDVAGAMLTVDGDTSGFLAAAGISAGTEATVADPDAAFDATGASAPQFDSGLAVQAGSFTVNGVVIAVQADDTINTVLARISASAAGVDAEYDAATQTVTLTARDFDADPIVVAGDTSGFLAAVKLDGTAHATTGGNDSAFDATLDRMTEYGGVTSGTLTVNGHAIAIDPLATNLRDLVATLNGITGVTAVLGETSGAIRIYSQPGSTVTLADTSGLLDALGIAAGTYSGTRGEATALRAQVGSAPANTADVVARITTAVGEVNAAVGAALAGRDGDTAFRDELTQGLEALAAALRGEGVRGVSAGSVDRTALALDAQALQASLDTLGNPTAVREAMTRGVDAFMSRAADAAARQAPAPPAAPARSQTIELTPLLALDRSAGQSRIAAARADAAARAETLRARALKQPDDAALERSTTAPARTGRITEPVVPFSYRPGVFEGIVDAFLRRLDERATL